MPKNMKKVVWLEKADAQRVIEKRAKRVLGVSANELRRQIKSGKFSGIAADRKPGLMALATLCSFTESHRARKKRSASR